jgi:hypothetical protein
MNRQEVFVAANIVVSILVRIINLITELVRYIPSSAVRRSGLGIINVNELT